MLSCSLTIGDNIVRQFSRRKDMSPELRAMFKKYNDDPEMSHYGFDTYEEALESLHQNPSHFIFANTMLAAHHFSLRRDRDLDIYAYKNGFKLSSHIPVGKGNPFKRILNAGMTHFNNNNNRHRYGGVIPINKLLFATGANQAENYT